MMQRPTPKDSSPAGANPAPIGRGDGLPVDSAEPDSWVSREEHERLLEEERKRRAGQERAHQKESSKLQRQIEDMSRKLDALATGQQARQAPALNLNPADPLSPVVEEIYTNQRQWADHMRQREEEERTQRQQDVALTEARQAGVPQDWLMEWLDEEEVELTPNTVRKAIREYQAQKRIADLEAELNKARQRGEVAATAVREELGATRAFTGTGSPPIGRTVDDQIAEVNEYISTVIDKNTDQAEKMRLKLNAKRILSKLEEWKRGGNRGAHPNYT